jgi:hypothetical protein
MTWYAWALVAYFTLDRLCSAAMVGRRIEITPGLLVVSLISGALIVWGIVSLAGNAA